jgi:hypothetical protein
MRTITISVLIAILALAPGTGCKKERNKAAAFRVNAVVGQVSINVPGNDARIGALLRPGDRIITGSASMAILHMPERSGIKIYENTDFLITAARIDESGPASDARFDLDRGSAFLAIEKLARNRSITVNTPTAVASVRGTAFKVEVGMAGDGKTGLLTGVSVVNGTVEVAAKNAPGETRSVTEGRTVVMAGDRIVTDTKELAAGELRELKAQESEIGMSLEQPQDKKAKEVREEKAAQQAAPVLKSEQAIREYYHKLEEVNLDDGSILIGAVIYQDTRVARIHTTAGVVQVPTRSIVTIRIR